MNFECCVWPVESLSSTVFSLLHRISQLENVFHSEAHSGMNAFQSKITCNMKRIRTELFGQSPARGEERGRKKQKEVGQIFRLASHPTLGYLVIGMSFHYHKVAA